MTHTVGAAAARNGVALDGRFHALDGIRGLAAIMVVCYHILPIFPGYLAVDLFFILSGFVLAYRYFDNPAPLSLGQFTISRLARLYPLHLFTLLMTLAVYLYFNSFRQYPDGLLNTFVQQLLLIHNLGFHTYWLTWNEPSWSISVEFWANLLFFAFLAKRAGSFVLLLLALVGYCLLMRDIGHLDVHVHMLMHYLNGGLTKCLAGIALGVVAYRAMRHLATLRGCGNFWLMSALECVVLAACLALLFYAPVREKSDFIAPVLFFALVVVFAFDSGLISRFIRLSHLTFFGTISYSLYLNQWWIFELFQAIGKKAYGYDPQHFINIFAVLIPVSIITYYGVEKPANRGVKKLAKVLRLGTS